MVRWKVTKRLPQTLDDWQEVLSDIITIAGDRVILKEYERSDGEMVLKIEAAVVGDADVNEDGEFPIIVRLQSLHRQTHGWFHERDEWYMIVGITLDDRFDTASSSEILSVIPPITLDDRFDTTDMENVGAFQEDIDPAIDEAEVEARYFMSKNKTTEPVSYLDDKY